MLSVIVYNIVSPSSVEESQEQQTHGMTKRKTKTKTWTKTNTKTTTKAKTRQMIRLDLSVAIRVLRIAGWCLVSDKHTLIWTRPVFFKQVITYN